MRAQDRAAVEAAVRRLAAERAPFTVDDVWWILDHEYGPVPGQGISGIMQRLEREGVMVRSAHTQRSTRPAARGRRVTVFLPPGSDPGNRGGWAAYDEITTRCPMTGCDARTQTWRGLLQHLRKSHGLH